MKILVLLLLGFLCTKAQEDIVSCGILNFTATSPGFTADDIDSITNYFYTNLDI